MEKRINIGSVEGRPFFDEKKMARILTKNSDKSLRNLLFYVKIIELGKDCCFGEILS